MTKNYFIKSIRYIILALLFVPALAFGQGYMYNDSPTENGEFSDCGSGSISHFKFNYNTCEHENGSETYLEGHIRSAFLNYDLSGNFTFRIMKCSGNFQNGSNGKIIIYDGYENTVYCFPYSVSNNNTNYIDVSIHVGNYTGAKLFYVYLVTSNLQNKLYGGHHIITGHIDCECNAYTTFTNRFGTFSDRECGSSYHDNIDCSWTINPNNVNNITLTFTSFSTEPNYDYVTIYDGFTTNSPILGTFSGDTIPNSVTSSSNAMLVVFHTDGSVTSSGWTASYTCSSTPASCSWTDCSTGNCGGETYFTHADNLNVAQYLCGHNIIDNGYETGGLLRPNDYITRAELAKLALNALFDGETNIPDRLVSDYFPCIYPDLERIDGNNRYYYRPAKALMYLEYGDGVSPFDRNRTNFDPSGTMSRRVVLKVLLETFNIAPSTSTASVFDDFAPSENFYGYAKRAYELGITNSSNRNFRPYDNCTRTEAFHFVYRILHLSSNYLPTVNNTTDIETSSFFIPSNLSPECLSAMQGLAHGNFQHYTHDCFSIPGWVNMNFGFNYQSVLSQEPDEYYPINPLGDKTWTHTYNMYINVIADNYTGVNVNWYYLHMNDGSVFVYKDGDYGIEKVSKGNYNTLTQVSSTEFTLTTVNQVVYRFEKLNSAKPIYYLKSVTNRFGDAINVSYQSFGSDGYYRINKVYSGTGAGYRELIFSYYSGTQRISHITDPISRTIHFYYNNDNNLSRYADAKGQNTYYYYDNISTGKDLLIRISLPNGNDVFNNYQQRKLISTRVNTNPATTLTYDYQYSGSQRNTISQVTQPTSDGNSTVTHYTINEYGRFTHITDNYHIDDSIFYEYPSTHPTLPSKVKGNLTEVVTEYSYNVNGQPTESITYSVDPGAGGNVVVRRRNRYNSDNTLNYKIGPMNDTVRYYYSSGALVQVRDAMHNSTYFQNNSHGKPISVTSPNGCVTNISYTPRGLPSQKSIPSMGISTSLSYDDVGRVTSSTDAMGNTTAYSYDNNDNTTSIEDALGNTTGVAFDANDNATSITNARGYSTYMQYDDNDFLTSLTFQGYQKTYEYYDDGKIQTYTDPNNHEFEFTYNRSNQVLSDGYATYSYWSWGPLRNITKDERSIGFRYDELLRVSRVTYDNMSVQYTYDAAGNRLTLKYPGNKTVTYTYNLNGQMTSVTDWNENTTNYFYRSDGQMDYVQLPNGVRTTYSYDNAGRRTGAVTRRNNGMGSVIAQYAYTLANNGMHTAEEVTEPYSAMTPMASETISYTYDTANRLLSAGPISFTYDNNGNSLTKGSRSYTWDIANNLTGVSGDFSASYTYDGTGNRRMATRGGVTTKYVLDIISSVANVLMETDENDNPECYYIYGAEDLLARIGADGVTTHYYISDFRGSIVAMTDASSSANITHQYQYDDFGKVIQSQESFFNPFRYVGRYGLMYETEDLYYCRARYYDPSIGRFLSEDPVWSSNLYPYAVNNPINAVDKNGEFAQFLILAIMFVEAYMVVAEVCEFLDLVVGLANPGLSAIENEVIQEKGLDPKNFEKQSTMIDDVCLVNGIELLKLPIAPICLSNDLGEALQHFGFLIRIWPYEKKSGEKIPSHHGELAPWPTYTKLQPIWEPQQTIGPPISNPYLNTPFYRMMHK